jgi:Coenzyme A transferase
MDAQEIIARRIARELRSGMLINLGIGIPTLVTNYLPAGVNVFFQSENGLIGTGPVPEPGMGHPTLTDAAGRPVTALPGACTFDSAMSFGLIRGGHVDLTVLGGLQVDATGRLANPEPEGGAQEPSRYALCGPPRPSHRASPRGGPLLRGQHVARLGQDHPDEAPPVGYAAAVDVVPDVVALRGGKIDRALPGGGPSSQASSAGERTRLQAGREARPNALARILLAAEPSKTLRYQTLLGEQTHEANRERRLRAVHRVEVLLSHMLRELLRVRDLARRHLAVGVAHNIFDLLRIHVRVLFLVVLDGFKEDGAVAVHEYCRTLRIDWDPRREVPRVLELILPYVGESRYVDRNLAVDALPVTPGCRT